MKVYWPIICGALAILLVMAVWGGRGWKEDRDRIKSEYDLYREAQVKRIAGYLAGADARMAAADELQRLRDSIDQATPPLPILIQQGQDAVRNAGVDSLRSILLQEPS